MSGATTPNPNLRKLMGTLLLIAVLFALGSFYVQATEPNPSRWVKLPFPFLIALLGLQQVLLPDSQLSQVWQRRLGIFCIAVGVLYLLTILV